MTMHSTSTGSSSRDATTAMNRENELRFKRERERESSLCFKNSRAVEINQGRLKRRIMDRAVYTARHTAETIEERESRLQKRPMCS